ncbi:MAG: WG repeat-containing protein [Myxococcota bacterium]
MIVACLGLGLLALPALAGSKGPRVVPERVGERFGYVGRSGRMVIQPSFDMVTPFRDGRATGMVKGRWGIIDDGGRWLTPPKYDWVHPQLFDEGPALVSTHGLYGYVDRNGVEVVPTRLEQATPFVDGYACLFDPQAMHFGIVDSEGLPVSGFRYDECDPGFRDGRARVRKGARWGYVGRGGALVLPMFYEHAEPFSEGLALIEEDGFKAYIDAQGRRVIPANGDAAGSFSQGRAWVRYGPDQVGFIDRRGARIGEAKWRNAHDFSPEGVAWVQDARSGLWALINRAAEVVVPPTYEDPGPFSEGLARVGLRGRYGFVNAEGTVVIPLVHRTVGTFHEGLVSVSTQSGGKQGVVDREGQWVARELYDQISPYRNGVARVTECTAQKLSVLGPETQVCEVFFVDRQGGELRR